MTNGFESLSDSKVLLKNGASTVAFYEIGTTVRDEILNIAASDFMIFDHQEQWNPNFTTFNHQQQWKIGTERSIAVNVNCSQYHTSSLVISAVEDGNIDHYQTMYYSFVNPATGLALSVEGTECISGQVIKMQHFKSDDEDQKFKLLKIGNNFLIQSKSCVNEEGSVLTKHGCSTDIDEENGNDVDRNLVLRPLEPRVRYCTFVLIYCLTWHLASTSYSLFPLPTIRPLTHV